MTIIMKPKAINKIVSKFIVKNLLAIIRDLEY